MAPAKGIFEAINGSFSLQHVIGYATTIITMVIAVTWAWSTMDARVETNHEAILEVVSKEQGARQDLQGVRLQQTIISTQQTSIQRDVDEIKDDVDAIDQKLDRLIESNGRGN